LPPAPSALAR
jgi:uncharacterized protein YecE (DUF72 family)